MSLHLRALGLVRAVDVDVRREIEVELLRDRRERVTPRT
jgi:hypothetical protein